MRNTAELTPEEVAGLTRLFESVFSKPCPTDLFHRKFGRAPAGWSLHSLLFLDGDLIGAFSAIPVPYRYFGEQRLFAITADLMIDPRHRGSIPRLQRMADALYEALARKGVAFIFCCLRNEIFVMHRTLSAWREIGKVHYYAAPLRNPWRAAAKMWNRIASPSVPQPAPPPDIEKVGDAAFTDWRYAIFPANYQTIDLAGGGSAVYVTELYYPIDGVPPWIRLGLLIDVSPLTKENFDAATEAIRRKESRVRGLAYQGNLGFAPRDLLRVPEKYEKQSWKLGGRVLNAHLVDERIFNIRNWNINLSSGDLV